MIRICRIDWNIRKQYISQYDTANIELAISNEYANAIHSLRPRLI